MNAEIDVSVLYRMIGEREVVIAAQREIILRLEAELKKLQQEDSANS